MVEGMASQADGESQKEVSGQQRPPRLTVLARPMVNTKSNDGAAGNVARIDEGEEEQAEAP